MPLITEEQRFVFIAIDWCSRYRFVFPGYPIALLAPPLMDFQKAQCTVSIISHNIAPLEGFISLQGKCYNWTNTLEFQQSLSSLCFSDTAVQQNDGMTQRRLSYIPSWDITPCKVVMPCHRIRYISWYNNKYEPLFFNNQNKHFQEPKVEVLFFLVICTEVLPPVSAFLVSVGSEGFVSKKHLHQQTQ